jgi:hypothetical protein
MGLDIAVPVIKDMRGEILRATKREPQDIAKGIIEDVRVQLNALRDIVVRAEREEFRVRIHPRDVTHIERFMLLQVRRILLSIFALTIALIASITYGSVRNVWLLIAGILVALLMFIVVLFLPTHLLENPMRHARRLKP